MSDTTVKQDILRGESRAGCLAPTTPRCCRDCGVRLVTQRADVTAGDEETEETARHRGHGYCGSCYSTRRYNGRRWDGPAPARKYAWKAADLVAEWAILRNRGLSRSEAAKALGVKPSTLTTAAHRARKYAERDKLRAEIAAAEAEAHSINDDMIAYAIRKGRAA